MAKLIELLQPAEILRIKKMRLNKETIEKMLNKEIGFLTWLELDSISITLQKNTGFKIMIDRMAQTSIDILSMRGDEKGIDIFS